MNLVQFTIFLGALLCQGMTYTEKEQEALTKFRNGVQNDLHLDYMKADVYLARWLQAKKWNVKDAVTMFQKSIKWREDNHADTAITDLRAKCSNLYPVQMDVITKMGEPAIIIRASDWDIRRKVLSGKLDDLSRCLVWFLEFLTAKMREANEKSDTKNLTHLNAIIDVGGFSLQQHACVQCLPLYIKSLGTYEANYPGVLGRAYFINTPAVFQTNLGAVKALMSEATRTSLVVFGFEKDKWQKALQDDFSPDQLPVEYGGTRRRTSARPNRG